MNYYEIGQRIRKQRKALGLSQEELAEKVGISVTHMSHIETGNTKLSLPVLVALAKELNVHTDDLLFENKAADASSAEAITSLLKDCSPIQIEVITSIAKAAKASMDKHI